MAQLLFPKSIQFKWIGFIKVISLFLIELGSIHFARHSFGIDCNPAAFGLCDIARNILLLSYSLGAALVLLALFDRGAFARLIGQTDTRAVPLCMNLAGMGLLFASLPVLQAAPTGAMFAGLVALWAVAIGLVIVGSVLMIAPASGWAQFLRSLGWAGPLVVIAGAVAPFVAVALRPLWNGEALSNLTFHNVTWMLQVMGQDVVSRPEEKIIGAGTFFVDIAPSCSGIEGLVLTTTFATIYMALFRADLRFPHALLILPMALFASWMLNGVRIAVLVQIGISGYPELAIGGFHSHAGWLMFTLLSLGIVLVAQSIPFFHARTAPQHSAPAAPLPPFFQDPMVAQIFPFLVFMASALLASTFSQTPAIVYPLRALAMLAALALFWPYLRALPWRIDPLAVGVGVFIAAYWVGFAPTSDAPPPFAELGAGAAAIWLIARCVGTSICVPIIEELFFRGYLMQRIAPVGASRFYGVLSVLVTSGLFAALHDRWIEAGIAGVLFALIMLRSRNVTDAIICHAVANALIAGWALASGNWSMI